MDFVVLKELFTSVSGNSHNLPANLIPCVVLEWTAGCTHSLSTQLAVGVRLGLEPRWGWLQTSRLSHHTGCCIYLCLAHWELSWSLRLSAGGEGGGGLDDAIAVQIIGRRLSPSAKTRASELSCCHVRTQREVSSLQPGRVLSPAPARAGTRSSDCQPPELWETSVCCVSLWYSVRAARQTETQCWWHLGDSFPKSPTHTDWISWNILKKIANIELWLSQWLFCYSWM